MEINFRKFDFSIALKNGVPQIEEQNLLEMQLQQNKNVLCYQQKQQSQKNNKNMSQSLQILPLKKVNRIKKKKQKLVSKQFVIKPIFSFSDDLKISSGLTLSKQGILKFGFSLGHVIFGYQKTQSIKFLQNDQIFQNFIIDNQDFPQVSVEQAIQFVLQTPCKYIQEVKAALTNYQQVQKVLQDRFDQIQLTKEEKLLQDEEFQKHRESCFEYIQQYAKDNEGQMFQYSIGRINYQKKGVEIVQAGYSKPFLDLVGVNPSNLSSLLLRNQRIELIKDQDEITRLSILGITKSTSGKQEVKISFKINTFDGFDISIIQTKKQLSPSYKAKKFFNLPFEYIFSITEFDVGLEDLQNLISYRQKIINSERLTFDEFVNKELSLLFEDVEYSILSQQFIDQYYLNNIVKIKKLQADKQINQQRCSYKTKNFSVNQSQQQQIQIMYK